MTRTVLLVEDELDARESLARTFERAGHCCVTAASYDEALTTAERTPHLDVIVTDLSLGPTSRTGLQLIPALRARGLHPPIIVITAFADVEKVKVALNAGAAFFIEKPFRAQQLLDAIDHVLREPAHLGARVDRALAHAGLTEKELLVAKLLLKGLVSAEIAQLEGNSERTIRQHISRIYEKCGVSSRPELFHHVFPS